jgi:hypothetical protein
MNTIKTLILAAVTALSLGAGAAMAQESAGGYIAGPFEQQELLNNSRAVTPGATRVHAGVSNVAPQYGSADRSNVSSWPVLEGGDGS